MLAFYPSEKITFLLGCVLEACVGESHRPVSQCCVLNGMEFQTFFIAYPYDEDSDCSLLIMAGELN